MLHMAFGDPERTPQPNVIYLLSQTILVDKVEGLTEPPAEGSDHGHLLRGQYSGTEGRISLATDLSPDTEKATLLHECLHAMLDFANLDEVLENEAHGLDEHLVGSLTPVLLSWMRENPELVSYLTERS